MLVSTTAALDMELHQLIGTILNDVMEETVYIQQSEGMSDGTKPMLPR